MQSRHAVSSGSFSTVISLNHPTMASHNTTGDVTTSGTVAGAYGAGDEGPHGQEVAKHLAPTQSRKICLTRC
jgi:broad specificity polyphosphatase/5'/3'-nucleotidase SurE